MSPSFAVKEGSEEEDEEEEEDEFDQEGLPDKIKDKVYPLGEEGERQLIEDLQKLQLEFDDDIDINFKGKAHWRKMPTNMHQSAIKEIEDHVKQSRDRDDDLLYVDVVLASVKVDRKGKKEPDLAIWGKDRLSNPRDGRVRPIMEIVSEVKGPTRTNPHVIFELSWSNDLVKKEIPKFRRQLNRHFGSLGAINVGFLIKVIPSSGTQLPPEDAPGSIPICGFDVYEARGGQGDTVQAGQPDIRYRVDEEEDTFISISSDDLGTGQYKDIVFPLKNLRDALEQDAFVVFAKQVKLD